MDAAIRAWYKQNEVPGGPETGYRDHGKIEQRRWSSPFCIIANGVTAGEVGYLAIEATTNQAICGMICHTKAESAYLYFSLIQSQTAISRLSNGGAQDNLSKNFIDSIKIVVPPTDCIEKLNLAAIIQQMILNTKEMALLEELQSTVLAQLASL